MNKTQFDSQNELMSLSPEEIQDIQDFNDRLWAGEVSQEEQNEVMDSLSKRDTKQLRMISSDLARKRRKDIRDQHKRVDERQHRKMKRRSAKAARIKNRKSK